DNVLNPALGSETVQEPWSQMAGVLGLESWPTAVGQEKRDDGRPVQSHAWIFGSSAAGGDPAAGGRPHSRRSPAWRVLRRAELFRIVPERRTCRTAAAAARGRHRAGQ